MKRDDFRVAVVTKLIKRGWSQRELARHLGLDEQLLSRFLLGKSNHLETAIRICRKLGLPVEYAERTCGISESVEVPK